MKKLLKVFITLALVQASLLSTAHAQAAGSDKGKQIEAKIAAVNMKLRSIQNEIDNAKTRENIARAGNSLLIGGEVLAATDVLISLKQKNFGKAATRGKYLLAAIATHISFLQLSPERTQSNEEAALVEQKANLQKLLSELQIELAAQ